MADRPGILLPPPSYPALALVAAWALDRWVRPTLRPTWALVAGVVLLAAAVGLLSWAAVTLRRHRTAIDPYKATTFLVRGGPYARSRNPIYVAFLLAQAGLSLAAGWLWGLLLLPATAGALYAFVIRKEERYLEAKFGDEYRAYTRAVRRWL